MRNLHARRGSALTGDHGSAWALRDQRDDEHLRARAASASPGGGRRDRRGVWGVMRARLAAVLAAVTAAARSQWAVDLGALGGTRTPSLLIRSKIMVVQRRPPSSGQPARTGRS